MSNATLWACRTGPRTTIHQLPDEVLLETLEWLPRRDYESLCLVSKKMYGITRPSLTKVFRVGRLAEALLPEGRLSILARSDLAKHVKELIIHPTHNAGYIMNLMAIEASALLSLLQDSLTNLVTLRIRDIYLTIPLLRAIADHPTLKVLDYDELATALAVSWRKITPSDREIGIPPLPLGSTTPPPVVHIPHLLVGSNPSRRNLNSARYPALARSSLLSSGRFSFSSITFLDLPSLFPVSHAWTPIPSLRRITLHELPQPTTSGLLADWFHGLIEVQPDLGTIELVMSPETHDGELMSEACGVDPMTALADLPWFGEWGAVAGEGSGCEGLVGENWVRRLRVKAERKKDGGEGGEITGVGVSFMPVNGIPQFWQRVRRGLKGLRELEVGQGLEFCSWNDTLRALSFPTTAPLRSLTLSSFLLPHSSNGSLIPSCTPACHLNLATYSPALARTITELGGSLAVWKHLILEANLDRVRSLGRVLPHSCEVGWSPQGGVDLGTWRGKVFRSTDEKAGGRGTIRESPGRPSEVRLPTSREAFKGVGTCWSCLEWDGETPVEGLERGGLSTPQVEWDLSRVGDDWEVSSRGDCVGKMGETDWVKED